MSNKNKNKSQKQIKFECNSISQEDMIQIQSEAFYRALKRIENEKYDKNKTVTEEKKDKWYNYIHLMLNALFFPWKINKRFNINKGIYDSMLVILISEVLDVIGCIMWFLGIGLIILGIFKMFKVGILKVLLFNFITGISFVSFGSLSILAGSEYSKETDSNKIYAYSACIIALISCVVSIISMFNR